MSSSRKISVYPCTPILTEFADLRHHRREIVFIQMIACAASRRVLRFRSADLCPPWSTPFRFRKITRQNSASASTLPI